MIGRLIGNGPLTRAAALAACLAASVSAQIRSAPVSVPSAAIAAPSAAAAAAAAPLVPALAPGFAFSAPLLPTPAAASAAAASPAAPALAALPAAAASPGPSRAAAPARNPAPDLNSLFDGRAAPTPIVTGDPLVTDAALALAEPVWKLVPRLDAADRASFHRALQAADYTGARDILRGAAAGARKKLGERAYLASGLPAYVERAGRAIDLPDHPEIARLRAGIADAERLKDSGKFARAMERVAGLAAGYRDGLVARTEHRFAFTLPLLRLKAELETKYGARAYFNVNDARELKRDLTAGGVHAWLAQRRAVDPAFVAGTVEAEPIPRQRWSDCMLQSLWNLPGLRPLRARMGDYDRFATYAEDYLKEPIRREGLTDGGSRRLLKHLGWDRSYDRAPRGEEALVAQIAAEGGVLGSYAFKMSRLTALLGAGSFDRSFNHAVAITAAVFDRGRWWFIVLDSNYKNPGVLTYGELLTMHLEIASVKPLP